MLKLEKSEATFVAEVPLKEFCASNAVTPKGTAKEGTIFLVEDAAGDTFCIPVAKALYGISEPKFRELAKAGKLYIGVFATQEEGKPSECVILREDNSWFE